MTKPALSRRQFLRSTAKVGMALTLTNAVWPAPAHAQVSPLIPIPEGLGVLQLPVVYEHVASGKGSLWVAGRFLNAARNNLVFENLPGNLRLKYHYAGAEYKSLPAARGLWESVPAPVRAAGPEAVFKFHKGKDWSHIVPRSVGGPATADNGVWWSSMKNRSLGATEMSAADLADARVALRSEAVNAALRQTLRGMVKGAILGVIVGAFLACLECGLEYAAGNITWSEMVDKIVKTSIFAGLGGLVITGLIIGITLFFPFLIPFLTPLLFALQIVSLLFLGRHLFKLAQGWWEVLDGAGKLADFADIVGNAQSALGNAYNELKDEGFSSVLRWLEALARRVGADNVWEWIATHTQFVIDKAGEFTAPLAESDFLEEFDAGAIAESVARVVATEFEGAISTTEGLLQSIGDYRASAYRRSRNAYATV
ncbi:MAG: hypothetical protein F4Z82_00690 [Caldilineaceae bacterium SB0668_bin_21]|nr:hypothetical protein [Caldilineaceae bacterium SB0668_bin_21]MYC23032.1 hypothetical protein [Caldilineaceae bacterium SB0662_bin_25]